MANTVIRRKQGRRSYSDLFQAELRRLGGEQQKLVNNKTLMEALGWDEERYERIKKQLKDENIIVAGRGGPGGAVAFAGIDKASPLKVFVSYCHVDEALKDDLIKHLIPLKRLNLISEWHDRKILAGDKWDEKISHNLEASQIILLLVSVDFINSKYCYDIEMDRALERSAEKGCVVIPVILRGCMWQHTRFADLQVLPVDGKAVTAWSDRDEAYVNVAEGIKKTAEKLLALS